ncbi:hypothetical protein FD755_008897 [Muntiacus reevesi]|uniref:Mos1 transposase HTH domain-containing protein n=1 Tax=Muntiacus reevesi TaxID=9886 RepID=A0A5J5MLJ6_MUNRE|nr:hypothetical protein FD755_008897 [Muntiacus reevesi]
MEMILDKKQIQVIFLFKFNTGHKAAEITLNINNTLGLGTANAHTVLWWFKKFCKGNETFEGEKHSGQLLEVDNDQLREIIKVDPLTITQEVAKELSVHHSMVVQHLKQTGKVKKLNKWVKKIIILKSYLLLFYNNEPCLDWIVTFYKKWIIYNNR